MSLSYLDFELEIGDRDGQEYPLAVINSPAGEISTMFRLPFSESKLKYHLVSLENAFC